MTSTASHPSPYALTSRKNHGGHLIWSASEENTTGITWCGVDASGQPVANGAYVYVIQAASEAQTFTGRGIVFIQR